MVGINGFIFDVVDEVTSMPNTFSLSKLSQVADHHQCLSCDRSANTKPAVISRLLMGFSHATSM